MPLLPSPTSLPPPHLPMLTFAPVISPWLAAISCVLITMLLIGSFFLFPLPKEASEGSKQRLDRDHPLVIHRRFKGIFLTSTLVPIYLWWILNWSGALPSTLSFSTRLGLFLKLIGLSLPMNAIQLLGHLVVPLLLVGILFMEPLLMMFIDQSLPFQARFSWAAQWNSLTELVGVRNFIVGPVAEEFIFRGCLVALVSHSGASLKTMVFGLPFVFGIAHLHHGYESFVKNGRTRQAFIQSSLVALVQLTYTTLFGWFVTFLFLRTSSLLGPCLCHSFCNMMGFPDVGAIQYYVTWKKWLYLSLGIGMVLFGFLLGPLTSPGIYGDQYSSVYWPLVR